MLKNHWLLVCTLLALLLSGCRAQEIQLNASMQDQPEAHLSSVSKNEDEPKPQTATASGLNLEDQKGFTPEIIRLLEDFAAPGTNGETNTFQDFDQVLNSDFLGLWYDPEMKEAILIAEETAYVYIPYLNLYGNKQYAWELVDRKDRGLCPELNIYYKGKDVAPLAYYVGGITENYFWCVGQGQVFYRVIPEQ